MARGNEKQVSAEIDATATTAAENDMTCERGPRMFVTSHGSLSSAKRKWCVKVTLYVQCNRKITPHQTAWYRYISTCHDHILSSKVCHQCHLMVRLQRFDMDARSAIVADSCGKEHARWRAHAIFNALKSHAVAMLSLVSWLKLNKLLNIYAVASKMTLNVIVTAARAETRNNLTGVWASISQIKSPLMTGTVTPFNTTYLYLKTSTAVLPVSTDALVCPRGGSAQ